LLNLGDSVQFGHFDGFTLWAADATPDGIGNDDSFRDFLRANIDGEQERHFRGVILAHKAPTETARSLCIAVTYPAFGSHST
jgi:hypothetical protein